MTAPDLPDKKAALRKTALTARKTAFAAAEAVLGEATARLLAEIGPVEGRVIAGYLPIRTEIDPRPAMIALQQMGARICAPVITGAGQPLDFREWAPDAALLAGPFGAFVPTDGARLQPGILIVPVVAFDGDLNRLGYGGGFYDRTIARLSAGNPGLRTVGFAFSAQQLAHIPTEPTDCRLDAVVTECGVTRA